MVLKNQRKKTLRMVISEVEEMLNSLKDVFSRGVNTETPELFIEVVSQHKENFIEYLLILDYKQKKKRVFVSRIKLFLECVKNNMTLVETLNAYEFLKRIRA